MKTFLLISIVLISFSSTAQKIKVLNFGTFHMAGTVDQYKTEYDQNSEKSKNETYAIAEMLSKFKPTVICVELAPSENEKLNIDYSKFIENKNHTVSYSGEIELIAYQIGKLAGVKKIYGIDDKATADYDYNIGNTLKNQVDSSTYKVFLNEYFKRKQKIRGISTKNRLIMMNKKEYQNQLINLNADILTHVSTPNNFEGADEASKFYRRNLRIYSNLNQIPLKITDRVFIITGGTHTAFLNTFLSRSPKYEAVNVSDYLK